MGSFVEPAKCRQKVTFKYGPESLRWLFRLEGNKMMNLHQEKSRSRLEIGLFLKVICRKKEIHGIYWRNDLQSVKMPANQLALVQAKVPGKVQGHMNVAMNVSRSRYALSLTYTKMI